MSLLMSANQKLVQLTFQELYCPEELFDKEQNWPKLLCWGNFVVFSKPDFKTVLADEMFLPDSVSERIYNIR